MLWASTSSMGICSRCQTWSLPLPFEPQGIEISDQGAGPAVFEKIREGFPGSPWSRKKGIWCCSSRAAVSLQTPQHEIVVPVGGREKTGAPD